MNEDTFYLNVARALSGCQIVEQQLKLYITEALELAKKCIGEKLPFKMSGEDYENCSLERLIMIFRKLTDNEVLVADLNKFKEERNFLSHKGITHCLDHEGGLFYFTAEEYQERLDAIDAEANRLRLAIHGEANKFRGNLYFDSLDEED